MTRTITRDEWERRKRQGYTLVRSDGTRCVLTMADSGATALVPVKIEGGS